MRGLQWVDRMSLGGEELQALHRRLARRTVLIETYGMKYNIRFSRTLARRRGLSGVPFRMFSRFTSSSAGASFLRNCSLPHFQIGLRWWALVQEVIVTSIAVDIGVVLPAGEGSSKVNMSAGRASEPIVKFRPQKKG